MLAFAIPIFLYGFSLVLLLIVTIVLVAYCISARFEESHKTWPEDGIIGFMACFTMLALLSCWGWSTMDKDYKVTKTQEVTVQFFTYKDGHRTQCTYIDTDSINVTRTFGVILPENGRIRRNYIDRTINYLWFDGPTYYDEVVYEKEGEK